MLVASHKLVKTGRVGSGRSRYLGCTSTASGRWTGPLIFSPMITFCPCWTDLIRLVAARIPLKSRSSARLIEHNGQDLNATQGQTLAKLTVKLGVNETMPKQYGVGLRDSQQRVVAFMPGHASKGSGAQKRPAHGGRHGGDSGGVLHAHNNQCVSHRLIRHRVQHAPAQRGGIFFLPAVRKTPRHFAAQHAEQENRKVDDTPGALRCTIPLSPLRGVAVHSRRFYHLPFVHRCWKFRLRLPERAVVDSARFQPGWNVCSILWITLFWFWWSRCACFGCPRRLASGCANERRSQGRNAIKISKSFWAPL